jgi:hypothetical protein
MKQLFVFLLTLLFLTTCNVSVAPTYHAEVRRHRAIAIMPFVVNLYAIGNNKLASSNYLENNYFVQRKIRNGQVNVVIQNVQETNKKLAELGITYKQIRLFNEKELARYLGVDSFIYGSIEMRNNPVSSQPVRLVTFSSLSLNQDMLADIDLKLASSVSGSIIWQYKEFNKGYSAEENRNDTLLFNCLLTYPLGKIQYKGLN